MAHHDRLRGRELVEGLEALLAAVAGFLDPAEGQLDAAAGAVGVDEDLAAAHRPRDPRRAPGVAGPDAGDEAVGRAVGEARRPRPRRGSLTAPARRPRRRRGRSPAAPGRTAPA